MKPNPRAGRVRPSKSVYSDTLRQEAGPLDVMAHDQRRVFAWALATLVSLFAGCDSLCENQEVQRAASPSSEWVAVSFTRDCGATTGKSSQVSLIAKDAALLSEPGNVLILEAEVPLQISWSPAGELLVHGSRHVKRFKEEAVVSNVKVSYP